MVMEQIARISKNCGKIHKFGHTFYPCCIEPWISTATSNNALKFSSDWYFSILELHLLAWNNNTVMQNA